MDTLLHQLADAVKLNHKGLKALKKAAVTCQQFELAVALREIETTAFPESEEAIAARKKAKDMSVAFKMVDLNIPENICWLICETVNMCNEKGGDFSLQDACKIKVQNMDYFPDNE